MRNGFTVLDVIKIFGAALHLTEHIHRTGGPRLGSLADWRGPPEDTQGLAGRPIGHIPHVHFCMGVRSEFDLDRDVKIDLFSPAVHSALQGQGLPDGRGSLAGV